MSRSTSLRLLDIIESCDRIESYIAGQDITSFEGDLKTQDAVIRQFEVIGEAVKCLPETLTASHSQIPWKQIAGFRDVLAHAYFAVDASVVWDAAENKAPLLKKTCEQLLNG